MFNHQGRRPWACVNFITAHDGFTLHDVVAFNEKHNHNEAYGENNQDGSANNRSWNYGAEGLTEDQGILALRDRQMRNLMATLLPSQGTPMVLAGDELARTQGSNNYAYCQDNEISWVDWTLRDTRSTFLRFVQQLVALRHRYPILRRNLFLTGQPGEQSDVRDVTWINASGVPMESQHWSDTTLHCFGMLLDGRAPTTGLRQPGKEVTVLVLINGHHKPVQFTLPPCAGAYAWSLVLDTNLPENPSRETFKTGAQYLLTDRSLVLLVLETQ